MARDTWARNAFAKSVDNDESNIGAEIGVLNIYATRESLSFSMDFDEIESQLEQKTLKLGRLYRTVSASETDYPSCGLIVEVTKISDTRIEFHYYSTRITSAGTVTASLTSVFLDKNN